MSEPRTATLDRTIDRALVLVAFLALVITVYASLRRAAPDLLDIPDQDKIGHAVAYFAVMLPLLFALVWRPGRGDGVLPNGRLWLVAGLIAVGIGMEVLQALFTSTRSPEVLDVVADAVGTGGALVVFGLVRRGTKDPVRR
jgi:VanZ family protein